MMAPFSSVWPEVRTHRSAKAMAPRPSVVRVVEALSVASPAPLSDGPRIPSDVRCIM